MKIEIFTFSQKDETLTEAWSRFKRLTRMCPHHGLSKGELVQAFYKGLEHTSRSWLDTSSGGVFMYKTPIQGYQLLEDLNLHNVEWTREEEIKGDVCSAKDGPQDEVALFLKHRKHLEKQIEMLTTSLHALEAKHGVTA